MYYNGFSAEETRVAWARAAEIAANRDDFSERSAVRHAQWTLAIVRGELHAAQELASTFLCEAEEAGRPVETGVARRSLGVICYYSGDFLTRKSTANGRSTPAVMNAILRRGSGSATTLVRSQCPSFA